uniref:Uncharacterized protein n=1 Tax=Triticum urartu TaxID=4572 RepID=A0A8R7QT53_TRIUA
MSDRRRDRPLAQFPTVVPCASSRVSPPRLCSTVVARLQRHLLQPRSQPLARHGQRPWTSSTRPWCLRAGCPSPPAGQGRCGSPWALLCDASALPLRSTMTAWRPSCLMCPSGPYFPASSLPSPLTLKLKHQLDGKHHAAAQSKPEIH